MDSDDKEIIRRLLRKGYTVVVNSPDGLTFNQRYLVYQGLDKTRLKAVLVNPKGKVIGLQG